MVGDFGVPTMSSVTISTGNSDSATAEYSYSTANLKSSCQPVFHMANISSALGSLARLPKPLPPPIIGKRSLLEQQPQQHHHQPPGGFGHLPPSGQRCPLYCQTKSATQVVRPPDSELDVVSHVIDDPDGQICVELGKPSIVNTIRMQLWDRELR
ncbi:unnamed protein product [Protopolystoma xenopodis]|uniref:Uncharacterized protein n=1 Tax=Protopolystoma xenopodis TaxID=117903 RepID=A0A3S5A6A6_9PLAT|nr:unnamed protein product [Protopolystoma xenopodis]